jgi:hypothetical protein
MGNLFVPGKIIQIRKGQAINRLAFIEVEEHIRHVRLMLDWLYPNASPLLQIATDQHDMGKKIYLAPDYADTLDRQAQKLVKEDILRADFFGEPTSGRIMPQEAIRAYKKFARMRKGGQWAHIKMWTRYQVDASGNNVVTGYSYQMDPPFRPHASSVKPIDLADLQMSDRDADYVLNLIRLHHNFRTENLVAAAAEHGPQIIQDLFRLIVADHLGSEWASWLVERLETAEAEEKGILLRFAEFDIETTSGARTLRREDGQVEGEVRLQVANLQRQSLDFTVIYWISDFAFDGAQEQETRKQ